MEDELIKVIVIGDSLVGKTSFIHRYVNNSFRSEYKSTIGVDFALKLIRWSDHSIKLQLWDIAGQDRFTFMTRAYYKDASGCVLMFDLSDAKTFEKVKKWKEDLDSKARLTDGSCIPCLLVANKSDLPERQVDQKFISEVCGRHGFVGWTEISVKDDVMVRESVEYLIDVIMGKSPRIHSPGRNKLTDSIALHKNIPASKSCSC